MRCCWAMSSVGRRSARHAVPCDFPSLLVLARGGEPWRPCFHRSLARGCGPLTRHRPVGTPLPPPPPPPRNPARGGKGDPNQPRQTTVPRPRASNRCKQGRRVAGANAVSRALAQGRHRIAVARGLFTLGFTRVATVTSPRDEGVGESAGAP